MSSSSLDQSASGLRMSHWNQVVFSDFKKIVKLNMFNPPLTLFSVVCVFTRLTGGKGQTVLEYGETSCYLKYEIGESGDDIFGFGIFQGLHRSALNSYIQICALVRCASSSIYSCGQGTRTSTTKFKSVILSGQFASNYNVPAVLVKGANPSKKDWEFRLDKKNNRGEINFASEISLLISSILFTRLYDRDNNTFAPDYKNPHFQNNHQSSQYSKIIIGIVVGTAVLACLIIIGVVIVKKLRIYQRYHPANTKP